MFVNYCVVGFFDMMVVYEEGCEYCCLLDCVLYVVDVLFLILKLVEEKCLVDIGMKCI